MISSILVSCYSAADPFPSQSYIGLDPSSEATAIPSSTTSPISNIPPFSSTEKPNSSSPPTSAMSIVNDGFEGYASDTAPPFPWQISTNSAFEITVDAFGTSHGNILQISPPSGNSIWRDFTETANNMLTAKFDLYLTNHTGQSLGFQLNRQNDQHAVHIQTKDDGTLTLQNNENGNWFDSAYSFTKDSWTEVKIECNLSTKTASIIIDGASVLTNRTWCTPSGTGSSEAIVRLRFLSLGRVYYLDNISVY